MTLTPRLPPPRRLFFALIAAFVAWSLLVLGNTTYRKRKIARELYEEIYAPDREVDIGVELATVVADPQGEELLPGLKLRIVKLRTLGGILDTQLGRIVAPTENPRRWYCSTDQEPVVLHADADPIGQVAMGSMGAGKTTALVEWTYCRWLEYLGSRKEGGLTAPTEARLDLVLTEIKNLYPQHWYRYHVAERMLEFADGFRVRMVSTHRQSAAQGSRIQGYNWVFGGRDEGQDQVDEHEHIEARLRSARGGRAKQLLTVTAKDDPAWRVLRDQLDAARDDDGAPLWIRRTMHGQHSPFVHPSHWVRMKASMTKRKWDQIVGARDVGPERATYPTWSHDDNLITLDLDNWVDVTRRELRKWGDFAMLGGHDPGTLFDVSLFLRAYLTHPKQVLPSWVVVGELTTEESTTEAHIAKFLAMIRGKWRINLLDRQGRPDLEGPRILLRCDPAGNTDTRTDKSVYTLFKNAGIDIRPAAYNADNTGHGRVPLEPGIEVVNTLLCNANEERRLYVARNPDGTPCAPKLVAALETSERELDGRADAKRKNKKDVSHWPAALRYPLWLVERPRLQLPKYDDQRGLT